MKRSRSAVKHPHALDWSGPGSTAVATRMRSRVPLLPGYGDTAVITALYPLSHTPSRTWSGRTPGA